MMTIIDSCSSDCRTAVCLSYVSPKNLSYLFRLYQLRMM